MADLVPKSRGISRLIGKIQDAMEAGNYYEAHQIFRTIYFRYTNQKRYEELLDLLYDGANKLINVEQQQSAADLAILIIDVLNKHKLEDGDFEKWIYKISSLIQKIDANVVEREKLLVDAIKWSCTGNKANKNLGHPLMHREMANLMAKEKNFRSARCHYLLAKDGKAFAKMLIELSHKALDSEFDLIIVQVVLHLLMMKETATALETFNSYTSQHPKIRTNRPPYCTPLLNFAYFLLMIIDKPNPKVFQTLCELYKTALSRDSFYDEELQVIGNKYFGIEQRQQRGGNGIFGDLFSQLFQDLESDDDEQVAPVVSIIQQGDLD